MPYIRSVLVLLVLSSALAAQDTWTKATPSNIPAGRTHQSMAYDSKRGVVVMFGGTDAGEDETWEYDGKTWALIKPTSSPKARRFQKMVYDEGRGVIVMFGGVDRQSARFRDTWEYDGKTWVDRGTLPVNEGRYNFAMAYDKLHKQVVRFGGGGPGGEQGDTHVWGGNTWKLVSTTGPSKREAPVMAYDGVAQRIILSGGSTGRAETWEWDGSKWSVLKTTTTHDLSDRSKMVYQAANGRILHLGPYSSSTVARSRSAPARCRLATGGWRWCPGPHGVPRIRRT
jgi:hypothetical protein